MSSPPDDPSLPPWATGDSHADQKARYAHLDQVCQARRADRLQVLLVGGWDVNECFYTSPWAEECQHALNMAVWHGWHEGLAELLTAGANTHKAAEVDCSPAPLMPDAVINFCNLATELRNQPSRDPATAAEVDRALNIVRMLTKHGCDVNRAGDDGLPVLQIAARCQDVRVLRLLLAAGAKVNEQNDRASAKGRSPLTKAVDVNNKAAVKLLLQYGADVNIRCQVAPGMLGRRVTYQSLIARSLDQKHYDVTELLVRAGCMVRPQDRSKLEAQLISATNPEKEDVCNDGWETEEEEEIVGVGNADDDVTPQEQEEQEEQANVTDDVSERRNADSETSGLPMNSARRRHSLKDRHIAEMMRLMDLFSKPLPLKGLCRRYLRQQLGFNCPDRVKLLSVPRVLKEYLLCRDL